MAGDKYPSVVYELIPTLYANGNDTIRYRFGLSYSAGDTLQMPKKLAQSLHPLKCRLCASFFMWQNLSTVRDSLMQCWCKSNSLGLEDLQGVGVKMT